MPCRVHSLVQYPNNQNGARLDDPEVDDVYGSLHLGGLPNSRVSNVATAKSAPETCLVANKSAGRLVCGLLHGSRQERGVAVSRVVAPPLSVDKKVSP